MVSKKLLIEGKSRTTVKSKTQLNNLNFKGKLHHSIPQKQVKVDQFHCIGLPSAYNYNKLLMSDSLVAVDA